MEQQGEREQRRGRAADGDEATHRVRAPPAADMAQIMAQPMVNATATSHAGRHGWIDSLMEVPQMHSRSARSTARGLVGALALLLALFATTISTAFAAVEPSLTVYPGDNPNQFQVMAAGFDDNQALGYSLTSPSGIQYGGRTHSTDGVGAVAFSFFIPRSSEAGQWRLFVWDKDHEMVTASATMNVALAQGPDAIIDASVANAASGAVITLNSARVFDDRETVYYWLTGPDGKVHLAGTVEANGNGRFNDERLALASALPRGEWTLNVYSPMSNHYGVAAITAS
jgi:hypothetical protein